MQIENQLATIKQIVYYLCMENLEQMETKQEEVEKVFDSAKDWKDLESMIDDLRSEEEAEKLKSYIKAVREGRFEDEEREGKMPETRLFTRQEGLRDKVHRLLIEEAKSWEDLQGKILQIGELESASGTYNKSELLDMIDEARKTGDSAYAPRAAGLQSKVRSLIKEEAKH